jgi:hypothetical protein
VNTLETLFPPGMGCHQAVPVPWLELTGGLKMWGVTVKYRWDDEGGDHESTCQQGPGRR